MTTVASRDLRNHTADVLRKVADGAVVTVTVNGRPVAEIGPVHGRRERFIPKLDLVELVRQHQADAGLSRDLETLSGGTTDDLDRP